MEGEMNNYDGISINGNLTAADFQRAIVWQRRKKLALVFGLVFLIATPIVFFMSGASILFTSLVIAVSITFVGLTAYNGIRIQAQKSAAQSEPFNIVFDEEGVHSISKTTASDVKWTKFYKICETDKDFIFFLQENLFYPIPKCLFENEDEIERVKILLRSHVGDRAKLTSSNV